MRNETIEALAQKDAERAAAAAMFYGEGAGNRRKLLQAELDSKFNMPGYWEAFETAYNKLDLGKFAEQAIREREKLDRAAKAGKNIRALKSGNLNNLSTGVFVVVGGAYLLHVTGYDKVLEAEAKKLYKRAKTEIKFRKARAKGLNVEKLI